MNSLAFGGRRGFLPLGLLVGFLTASLQVLTAQAQEIDFDLSRDWSDTANPMGPWALRSGDAVLQRLSEFSLDPALVTAQGWGVSSNTIPFAYRSPWAPPVGNDWQAGDVIVHTRDEFNGWGNGELNILWTSPTSGRIRIEGAVWEGRDIASVDGGLRGNRWSLYIKGVLKSAGAVAGGDPYSRANPFTFDLGSGGGAALQGIEVEQGDVVRLDLVRTTWEGDYVGVNFRIVLTPDGPVPSAAGLVASWPADGNAASTPPGNDGTLLGGAGFASGAFGQAFLLDGVEDHVKIPASPSLNVGTGEGGFGLTIEGWINPANLAAQQPILEWNSGAAYGAHFFISVIQPQGGGPGCLFANLVDTSGANHVITTAGGLVASNQWQHVAVTYDRTSGDSALYLDGTLVAQANLGSFEPLTSFDVLLGYRPPGFDGSPMAFGGRLDEIRLYGRALPASTIAQIAAAVPPIPGLIAHWQFDESVGDIAHDSAGTNQGVLNLGAAFVQANVSGNAVALVRELNGLIDMGQVLDFADQSFSLAAWVVMADGDTTENSLIVSKHEAGFENGYFLNVNVSNSLIGQRNKASFYAGNAAIAPTSRTSVNDGRWHHLVAVHEPGGENVLYVDGVRESSAPAGRVMSSPARFLVGGASFDGIPKGHFDGQIDELQVYSRALSAEEVQVLYQLHAGQPQQYLWVTTAAGSTEPGHVDGFGAAARFNRPNGGFVGIDQGAYIADTDNHVIRFFETFAARTITFAGTGVAGAQNGPAATAQFNQPLGTFADAFGNVFVADTGNNLIRRIAPGTSEVSTYAGSGTRGYFDGPAAEARFDFPNDLVKDADGNLFVTEFNNHTIRKVLPDGHVVTFVGNGQPGFADGIGMSARLNQPAGLAIDAEGNLYVSEWGSHRIRKVTPEGAVTTLAGSVFPGFLDGAGADARFNLPDGLLIGWGGELYVADAGNHAVRRVSPDGTVTTLAGAGVAGHQDGAARSALFNGPGGLGIDVVGRLIVVDTGNHCLRRIHSVTAPQVTLAPTSQTALLGSRAEFVAEVRGSGPFTFAWKHNGVEIPGATGSGLILVGVQSYQAGKYTVVVSNPVSSTESAPAQLTVRMPIRFERTLPVYYGPEAKLTVRLEAILPDEGTGYAHAVEEFPPANWVVSNVSMGGVYDADTHKVKFGPFFDFEARVLTYELIPPAGDTGEKRITGVTSADGGQLPVLGDEVLLPPPVHPADWEPVDRRINVAELTAYSSAWRRGANWTVEPNPIPIDYVTRAGFLWKNGERYWFRPDVTRPPLWWTDAIVSTAARGPGGSAATSGWTPSTNSIPAPDTATRLLPTTFVAGQPFVVHVFAQPGPGVSSYAVEEDIPEGLAVSDVSDGGEIDSAQRRIKWGPYFDQAPRDLHFTAVSTQSTVIFAGRISFDGASVETKGSITVHAGIQFRSAQLLPSGELVLGVGSADGRPYMILTSTNLHQWIHLTTVTNATGVLQFRDPDALTAPHKFYRARW